jgi:hypothetical protein
MNDDALISAMSQNISENESWFQAFLQTEREKRVGV